VSYNEALHIEVFCHVSDRGTLDQPGFAADSEFQSATAVGMIHAAGNRPLVATLIGVGMEGLVLFGFVTGAKHHPPGAIAGDGVNLSFVRCDHKTYDPIVRVTSEGNVVGEEDARTYWATAHSAMSTLGLKFADNEQERSNA
jgi:hypothetical protein